MNKKRILIVTSEFPPQPGGIGNHAYNLAHQLSLNNYLVSVIADQRSFQGEEELQFDKDLNFKVYRIRMKRLRVLMYVQRLYTLMRLVKAADVVIASGKFSLWNVAFSSLFQHRTALAVIHGSEVNFKNTYLRKSVEWSLKRFDHIIAVSKYTKSLIAHLNLKVTVIPNGYDSRKWKPHVVPLQNLSGYPKLITVGNVTARKGQLNVILQLPDLIKKYPNIHYHCIGLPTEAEDFMGTAKALNVQDHVTFHGRVDDNKLQQMLMASDIFVMLSNETATGDVEGFGIAVIEANALGIPAIGSSGSGLEDAIKEGVTGFLIPVDPSTDFQGRITDLLEDHEVFSSAAVEWAHQHEWEINVKQYKDVIEYS